jgi:hypothetical protein
MVTPISKHNITKNNKNIAHSNPKTNKKIIKLIMIDDDLGTDIIDDNVISY